jgi:hypothetical protein
VRVIWRSLAVKMASSTAWFLGLLATRCDPTGPRPTELITAESEPQDVPEPRSLPRGPAR